MAFGAQLRQLKLDGNQIGDKGLEALSGALATGAMPQLRELRLNNNKIGDAGVEALAKAAATGALPRLKEIWVDNKHMQHPQLVAACQPRGIAIK